MIRELKLSDAPHIFSLIQDIMASTQVPIGSTWTPEQVDEECRQKGWVSCDSGGKIEAFVFLREAGDALEMTFLGTANYAKHQGLMSRTLLPYVLAQTRPRPIWLEVHAQNAPARRLYERSGFKQVGERKAYYHDGGSAILYNYD